MTSIETGLSTFLLPMLSVILAVHVRRVYDDNWIEIEAPSGSKVTVQADGQMDNAHPTP